MAISRADRRSARSAYPWHSGAVTAVAMADWARSHGSGSYEVTLTIPAGADSAAVAVLT